MFVINFFCNCNNYCDTFTTLTMTRPALFNPLIFPVIGNVFAVSFAGNLEMRKVHTKSFHYCPVILIQNICKKVSSCIACYPIILTRSFQYQFNFSGMHITMVIKEIDYG